MRLLQRAACLGSPLPLYTILFISCLFTAWERAIRNLGSDSILFITGSL